MNCPNCQIAKMLTKKQIINNLDLAKRYIREIDQKFKFFVMLKNHYNGEIIFASSVSTYPAAIRDAVAAHIALKEVDFSGLNLEDMNFSGLELISADFSGARLRGANFEKCNLMGSNFRNTDLRNTNFQNCDLWQTDFSFANLTDSNLRGARITSCIFDFGCANGNFEAFCKAFATMRHGKGKFEDFNK